jgi:type I restriction enzyme S subunit
VIPDLKPYPTHKDSGVPWLGSVPQLWNVSRIKNVFREKDDRSGDGKGTLLSLTRARGLLPQAEASNRLASAEDLSKYKVCRPNELVMNRMQAWSGMFAVARMQGLVSPDYSVFRCADDAEVTYYEYLFKTPAFVAQFAQRSKGIGSGFNRLYTEDFGAIAVLVPPHGEQSAIVRFIDHTDRRIARYIRAKRRLVEFLDEQRQVIIHETVTRGLRPNVPSKQSGIPWLWNMPAHWDVIPFVRCAAERSDYRGATPEKVDSGVLLVTAKNVRMGWIDYETSKEYVRVDQYERFMRRGLPRRGDVLLTTEAPLGNVALVDREDIALAQRIIRFGLNRRRLIPEFALYALTSPYFQNQLQVRSTGSTAHGIKASKLPQLLVVLPSVKEQRDIVAWLQEELAPFEEATNRAQREIQLIREYRTRLVADVVTGNLDVRDAAAKLPEEPVAPDVAGVLEGEDAEYEALEVVEAEAGA